MNYIWQGVNAVSLDPMAYDYMNLLENINVCIRVKDILNVVDQLFFSTKVLAMIMRKLFVDKLGYKNVLSTLTTMPLMVSVRINAIPLYLTRFFE
ncbi:hypothetical protein NBRC116494_07490 [Aurantivibrio plasticivorans]